MNLQIGPAYRTLDDVVNELTSLEQQFAATGDRRGVFVTVYGMMSREMRHRVATKFFLDNEWVAGYLVTFANYYRQALMAFEAGDRSSVPRSWRVAFDTARSGSGLALQDLLLGVNAHVNHDLALGLDSMGIDPDRDRRHRDHTSVNQVLEAITDAAQTRVCTLYAPGLAALDRAAGSLDEVTADFSMVVARESAWETAVALANARNDLERAAIRRALDFRAGVVGRLLVACNVSPLVVRACRQIEAGLASPADAVRVGR
jgi:hypothetical protein